MASRRLRTLRRWNTLYLLTGSCGGSSCGSVMRRMRSTSHRHLAQQVQSLVGLLLHDLAPQHLLWRRDLRVAVLGAVVALLDVAQDRHVALVEALEDEEELRVRDLRVAVHDGLEVLLQPVEVRLHVQLVFLDDVHHLARCRSCNVELKENDGGIDGADSWQVVSMLARKDVQ